MKQMPVLRPSEIEMRSMEIIREELSKMGVRAEGEWGAVLCRVIHTTADFDYTKNLCCSPDAVRSGIRAIRSGVPVITDTSMAASGISSRKLKEFGGRVLCHMADADVAEMAQREGTTRAVCAMRKAGKMNPDAVYAIGNAPTALFELAELMKSGRIRPSLVIAVPVGFVNVEEAKETLLCECRKRDVPVIAAMGRKGGSTVAAAIVNALIYEAAGLGDPAKRDVRPVRETGLIHIYTGDGKGKTTAAIGLAVRAAGCGYRVLIEQFMKDEMTSERKALSLIPGITLLPISTGLKFSFRMTESEKEAARAEYRARMEEIRGLAAGDEWDVLILDEALYAIRAGLLDEEEIVSFLKEKPDNLEVVLTGRDPGEALLEMADYVSVIRKRKHPFSDGRGARLGIEK